TRCQAGTPTTDIGYRDQEWLADAINQDDALFVINLAEADLDDFGVAGLHCAAHVLRLDGHFAMAAINEYAEGDALGAPEVEQAVHRCPDGAARVEDVVNKDEVHAIHGERNIRGLQDGLRSDLRKVVAVKSDVERPDGNIHSVNAAHGAGDALGQG